jgi:hypothetical protein
MDRQTVAQVLRRRFREPPRVFQLKWRPEKAGRSGGQQMLLNFGDAPQTCPKEGYGFSKRY